jgi:hypothetical protein
MGRVPRLCHVWNRLSKQVGPGETHERTARRLENTDKLSADMRHAKEGKGLNVSLGNGMVTLTKNRPLNSSVLWNTPLAPSLSMTNVMTRIINCMNAS